MAEGTSEIEEHRIVLTENAARRIAVLRDQETGRKRISADHVSGGRMLGVPSTALLSTKQRNAEDFVFERTGVAVVVDDVSLSLLNGAEVDFVEISMGASFQYTIPMRPLRAAVVIPFPSADALHGLRTVKIASWNVNSVKARLPHLLAFLEEAQPDVLCLQETKCPAADSRRSNSRGSAIMSKRRTARL